MGFIFCISILVNLWTYHFSPKAFRQLNFERNNSRHCNVSKTTRWSADVIRRTGIKNFNAVSHNRARPYIQIQHGRGEVRARRVYLDVHSVTGNVVDTEWSVELWRWKCCREFGNNTWGRVRLWDTAWKFFFPVLQITSPDHLGLSKSV